MSLLGDAVPIVRRSARLLLAAWVLSATQAGATDSASSPPAPSPAEERPGWIALPVVSYAPETSLQLGAYLMRYFRFDAKSPRSTVGGMATATLRKQVIVELKPSLHFHDGDYRLEGHLELQRFPDNFYGVGNAAEHQPAEKYERRMLRLVTNFRRRVHGSFHVGTSTDQSLMAIDANDPHGLLATHDYLGEQGGTSSGIGVAATFDSRDDHAFTTAGAYVEMKLVTFLRAFGSDYQLSRTSLDARYFVRTGHRQALALRYLLEVAGGTPPFYQLPTFGGANSMRGYYLGKYRDLLAHALEAEFRARVWWRFGAALFGSAGQVGATPRALASAPLRPSVGGGLRFDLSGNDGFNLRADFAGWPGDAGLYLAVMEAF